MRSIQKIFHFLFPNSCIFCLENRLTSTIICPECEKILPCNPNLIAHGFENLVAPFSYQEPIKKLITDLKFNGQLKYAQLLGELLTQKIIQSKNPLPTLIIPVPLHPKRLRERGFNQAIEIAKVVGKKLHIPVDTESLIRTKNTKAQSDLKSQDRQKNVEHAFLLNKKIKGEHFAILDDVFTTGATIRSCIQAIGLNEKQKISVWCCARVSAQRT
jgi:ComF family protein